MKRVQTVAAILVDEKKPEVAAANNLERHSLAS
jgi:hypothetical protein